MKLSRQRHNAGYEKTLRTAGENCGRTVGWQEQGARRAGRLALASGGRAVRGRQWLNRVASLDANQREAYQAARGEGLSDNAARAFVANTTGEGLAVPGESILIRTGNKMLLVLCSGTTNAPPRSSSNSARCQTKWRLAIRLKPPYGR